MSPGSKQQTQNKERPMSSWPCFCNEFNGRNKKEWREEEGATDGKGQKKENN